MFTLTGDSGVVYQVDDAPFNAQDGRARLYTCRDNTGRDKVIKLYPAPISDQQAADSIRSAATRSAQIFAQAEAAGSVGQNPESAINLPIDVITDRPGIIGVVLPPIPREFLYDGQPRTFDELNAAASPPDAAYRVGVMMRVAEIFAVLEETGLVHGDVSQQNLLWRADQPDAYLINWNGMPSPYGDAQSQGYVDPRLVGQQIGAPDGYSDRYGLAVAMYRCLLLNQEPPVPPGQAWNPSQGVPQDLDPRLRSLFDRAFSDPYATDGRPGGAEWRDTVRGAFVDADGRYRLDALGVLDRHAQRAPDGGTALLGGVVPGPEQPPQGPYGPPSGPGGPYQDPYQAAAAGGIPPQQPPYGGPPGGPPLPAGGPGGPGGPPRKQGLSGGALAAIIGGAAVVLLIIVLVGVFFVIPAFSRHSTPTATPIAVPTSQQPVPTYTPYSPTPYDSPTPYSTDPYDSPTPYQPPQQYWGAIAVAPNGAVGKSWDYDTAAGARSRALNECPASGCKVLVTFVNGCGAVAFNSSTNRYWGGHGDTQSEAENNAIANAGGGSTKTWVCTTR